MNGMVTMMETGGITNREIMEIGAIMMMIGVMIITIIISIMNITIVIKDPFIREMAIKLIINISEEMIRKRKLFNALYETYASI
jgi:hypothetical protein